MRCSSFGRRYQLLTISLFIGLDDIKPVATVKNLGLHLDATRSMRNHISHLTSTCFGVLRQIRCMRRRLSSRARIMLITCFVFGWLDYCNAMFMGLPRHELVRLQAVKNAAVRLIAGAGKFDHVTPLLRERHWLLVEQRITFKMAVMTYKCVHGTTADYLADYIRHHRLQLPTYIRGQPVPAVACGASVKDCPRGPILMVHVCGTACLPLSYQQVPWPFSKNN